MFIFGKEHVGAWRRGTRFFLGGGTPARISGPPGTREEKLADGDGAGYSSAWRW
jgi:hypothetical protein